MLSELKIKGFKSLKEICVSLRPLTLLSGLNSSGKSSVLQAVRMLCDSFEKQGPPILEGHGGVEELRCKSISSDERIEIICTFNHGITASLLLTDNSCEVPATAPMAYYLSAARKGPEVTLPIRTHLGAEELPYIGNQGEYIVGFLDALNKAIVPEPLRHPAAQGITLEYQLAAWLTEVSPGIDLQYEIDPKRDTSRVEFNSFRPTNVGFGLSYSLPIITAVLGLTARAPVNGWECQWGDAWEGQKADRGVLLMIENPEAHLHPQGQTALGRLLAVGASCGLQLLVETHSDHLMDGIRIAVRDGELNAQDAQFHFFARSTDGETEVETPKLAADGKLNFWPKGFFDQTLRNRARLAR